MSIVSIVKPAYKSRWPNDMTKKFAILQSQDLIGIYPAIELLFRSISLNADDKTSHDRILTEYNIMCGTEG